MIRDAALLEFLDNDSNRADAPNENLGRELLELFTLGEGAFSEQDVAEAARALTAATPPPTRRGHPFPAAHLGSGRRREDAVREGRRVRRRRRDRAACSSGEAAARYLAARFWRGFIADGEAGCRVVGSSRGARFRESGHDLGALYRETLSSEAFWATENRAAIVRSPLDLLIGTARSLDYPKRHWRGLARELGDLDMALFAPPDVAGWREGAAYVGGGLLLERAATARAARRERWCGRTCRDEHAGERRGASSVSGAMGGRDGGRVDGDAIGGQRGERELDGVRRASKRGEARSLPAVTRGTPDTLSLRLAAEHVPRARALGGSSSAGRGGRSGETSERTLADGHGHRARRAPRLSGRHALAARSHRRAPRRRSRVPTRSR